MKKIYVKFILLFLISISNFSCGSIDARTDGGSVKNTLSVEFKGDESKNKNIFVFMDGTANDSKAETNVWRLFTIIRDSGDSQLAAKYIPGVCTSESTESDSSKILGCMLGQGMEVRIKLAYDFLAKNYNPGDKIYIFGFSRGAHTARSLAGFISYVGIPIKNAKSLSFGTAEWNRVIELAKKENDKDYITYWSSWKPTTPPPLAARAQEKLGVDFLPAQITMLGVWDTVPGSSLKKFGTCKELPDNGGDRYKSDTYPTIRTIAHAVALDEKRNKFKPLLICPTNYPLDNELKPEVTELWFPGAHADVGGGYSDGSNELPNISLNWMIEILGSKYKFSSQPQKFFENASGLAHWSVADMSKLPGMKCEDRAVPAKIEKHDSVHSRTGAPPIRVKGKMKHYTYPILCANERDLLDSQ